MIIKIGDYKEITVDKQPSVQRNRYTGQDILTVTIPNGNVDANTLAEIRTYIKENSPEILVLDDEGTLIQTMTGFYIKPNFHPTETDDWELVIENRSELDFQYGRLLDENAKLKEAQTVHENEIVALAEENAASIEIEAELLYELSLMQLGLL